MRIRNVLGILGLTALSFATGLTLAIQGVLPMSGTQYIQTEEPMLLAAEGEAKRYYMLPPGTPLYKVNSSAEGHTTYSAYINIKGEFANRPMASEHSNLIDPIWAFPIESEDVAKLMSDVPLTRDDLVRILKARSITRDDLAYIVREFDK